MSGDYGWADGMRVPLSQAAEVAWSGEDWAEDEGEGSARERVGGGWWPSDSVRALWLEVLSREEAAEVSAQARQELVYWLAGEGLHPLRWMRRWAVALGMWMPGEVPGSAGAAVFGSEDRWAELALGALFPGRDWRGERRRLESVWGGMGSRCAVRGQGARGRLEWSLAGALGWCGWSGPEGSRGAAQEEAQEVASLAMGGLVRWLGSEGGWCLGALKRYYVLVFVRYRDLAPGMTGQDFGALYGQTRAAFCEDGKRFVGLPLEHLLGYRPKVAGQKSAEAAAVYAANAARHCPRRELGPGAERGEEEARAAAAAQRLKAAKAAAAQRELERDAREMEERARRNGERRRRGRVKDEG